MTIKLHKPASVQTIGHWINDLLKKAGVDTDIFTAYKAKHAAVSKAYSKGVNVDTIRRTAGWSKRSIVFASFYNRLIIESNETFTYSLAGKK